jgi:DegV family protein with EDD domain
MTKFTIITDSCCNLYPRDLNSDKIDFHVAPLTLTVGDQDFVDDEKLDIPAFIKAMTACKTCGKSACPSPDAFYQIMKGADNILILTLSSKLSGTHASAGTAVDMIAKEFPTKKVYLQDSLSAATGLDFILNRLKDVIESGADFDAAVARLKEITGKTRVRFLLQDLNNLVKNGRMSKMMGRVLSTAHVKLICGDDGEGEITKYGLALGTRRGLAALAALPAKDKLAADSPIEVAHVQNEADAQFVKDTLAQKFGMKNVVVRPMRGLSSFYAADKGIVIAY